MGRFYGLAEDGATFDFPGHGFESVSSAFKPCADVSNAETINDIIKATYVPELQDIEIDGLKIEPLQQLPWYV
jgi:hypothetical protein